MDDQIDRAKLALPYVYAWVTVQELLGLGLNDVGKRGPLRILLSFQLKIVGEWVSERIASGLLLAPLVENCDGADTETALEI